MPIQRPRILHASQMAGTGVVSPSNLNATAQGSNGNKNFIINGGMTISQRGTSFTNPSSDDYCLDRYAIQWAGMSPQFTVSQDTSTPAGKGFYKSLKIATSNTQTPSGGQGAFMYQKVEGSNISNIMFGTSNAKTLTLSFYVKSSKTGTYSVGFHNNGFNRNLVSEYTISSADTWERKTITFAGDTSGTWTTDNTIGMGVYFHLSNGDGSNTTSTLNSWQSGNYYLGSQNQVNLWDSGTATWFITGIQLEIGDAATEFEHESYATTLEKCLRYFYAVVPKGVNIGYIAPAWFYSSSTMVAIIDHKVEMRAAPAVESVDATDDFWFYRTATYDGFNDLSISAPSSTKCTAVYNASDVSGTTGHAGGIFVNDTTNAFLYLKAEL